MPLDEHATEHGTKTSEELQKDLETLAEFVDGAIKTYDENNDGYIHYGEFYRYN